MLTTVNPIFSLVVKWVFLGCSLHGIVNMIDSYHWQNCGISYGRLFPATCVRTGRVHKYQTDLIYISYFIARHKSFLSPECSDLKIMYFSTLINCLYRSSRLSIAAAIYCSFCRRIHKTILRIFLPNQLKL